MSKSIVIPDDCDLHKTYTHGRSQGGARSLTKAVAYFCMNCVHLTFRIKTKYDS